jgi:hypothetical protein
LSDKLHVPGLTEDETVTLNLLVQQLKKKSRRNKLRTSYYDGKRAIRQVGSVIPPQYYKIGLALGWTAKGVDGLARRCNLDKMYWTGGDLDSLGIQELQESNFLFSELAQGRTDSLIHGVSYLITTQGQRGEPKALVHAKDALSATGDYNARTRRLDNLLSVTSRDGEKITGFNLYLDGLTISSEIGDNGRWTRAERSDHSWGVPAEPLIYSGRSSRRFGRSRITRPAMSHQDAALRALVRLEGHMDIYAIPKLIMLGASESIFKNSDGTAKTSWQVAFGRVFGIPDADPEDVPAGNNGRADVKQFAAESPEPHLAQLNALAKLMARETDLPDSDFALTDMANPTSADAYNASRENLIAEAEGAMDDWSVPIRRTVARALAVQNGLTKIPAEWAGINAKWRSPVYLSRAAAADAGAKQLSVVPWLAETEVGLELLGLDAQQIERALAEKRRNAGRAVIASLGQTNGDSA